MKETSLVYIYSPEADKKLLSDDRQQAAIAYKFAITMVVLFETSTSTTLLGCIL
jgi:hypothetical protein